MLLKINKDNKYNFMSEDLKMRISQNLVFEMKDLLKMIKLGFGLSAKLKFIENSKITIEVLIVDYINIIASNNIYKNISKVDSYPENSHVDIKSNLDKSKDQTISEVSGSIEKEPVAHNENKIKDKPSDEIEADKSKEPDEENPSSEYSHEIKDDAPMAKSNINDNMASLDPSIDTIKSNWKNIISALDKENSKLSSFFEETTAKEIKNSELVLELNNGNQFIKKVLETDKSILVNVIKDVCGFNLDIIIEMQDAKEEHVNQIKDSIDNKDEKDHPLLDDAINMFKGKIIS